jgi:hypothetical protein
VWLCGGCMSVGVRAGGGGCGCEYVDAVVWVWLCGGLHGSGCMSVCVVHD